MKDHYVITIGCEYGAKGNAIGKKIAKDLGIPVYDRQTVDDIISEVGISSDVMDKVESGKTIAGKGAEGQEKRGSFSKLSDLTERAIHVQKQIIKKLAKKESCVFIGRSADYILKDECDKLSVFLYAPEDVRLKNVMESHNLEESDAQILISAKESRFHARHLAFTGSNRGDRHNRDLLLDSSILGVDGTAEYIEILARKMFDL